MLISWLTTWIKGIGLLGWISGMAECAQNLVEPTPYHLRRQQNLGMNHPQGGSARHAIYSADSRMPNTYTNEPAKDFVTIVNPPTKLTKKMKLKVKYQCTKPMVITVLIDGYENDDNLLRNSSNSLLVNDPTIFFQKSWQCSYSPTKIDLTIKPKLPKRFVFQPSLLLPKVSTLEDSQLKIFMSPMNDWNYLAAQTEVVRNKFLILYEHSKLKLHIPLHNIPPLKRPKMKEKQSLAWQGQLVEAIMNEKPMKSVAEEECSEIITYPTVMSEEPYGVVLGYYPYFNAELQRMKQNKLRFTLTMELYLFSYCDKARMCGLFQHLDFEDKFETPMVLLSQTGNLHVQVKTERNNTFAHSSSWKVPIGKWVRINYVQTNNMANITLYHGKNYDEPLNFVALFQQPIMFEEHKGFMVIGGTIYCKNINGIVSYTKLCRNKALQIDKANIPSRRGIISNTILKLFKKQQKALRNSIKRRWQHYSEKSKHQSDVCIPYFLEIIQNATCRNNHPFTPVEDVNVLPTRLETVEEILFDLPAHLKSKDVLTQTKAALYKKFLEKLENPLLVKNITSTLKLLKQSARLGDGASHFLLYSILKNGVGTKKNLIKARFHLLLGAQLGDNLCLKALAYNHLNGLCGFKEDINLAFFYYFNLAHKTQEDLLEHVEGQTMVNNARLTDEKKMKEQISEGDDVFEWLKLQATKGAFSAQRNMARLLYWGQQGLQRNLEAALKYYEEAAQGGDPVAMYDYGLALVKGHGGEVDMAKGIEVLRQAADVENPAALNTLGWYHATEEVNMTKAVEYFEKSEKLGSIDAAYNLGHMYHMGKYPGKDRDMKMAFKKYYRAAAGGHTEASLQVAYLTATGVENFVPRNPHLAVQWAKYLTERNPTMGELIREGLQAFRKQHWAKALLIYMAVGDTGFEVAQYNTAFLCETDGDKVIDFVEEECIWKNWNISSKSNNPHPYALNKMGDYHYYGHGGESDLKEAINYYRDASKMEFPQALFNLANIMEEHGDVVGNDTIIQLSLPQEALQSFEDAIVHLYRRCTEMDSSDSSLPCHIALMRTQLMLMWKRTSLLAKVLTIIVMLATTVILVLLKRKSKQSENATLTETRLENGLGDIAAEIHVDEPITVVEEHED